MNRRNVISCEFSGRQKVETHFHADFELLYVLKGELLLSCNGETHLMREDAFYLINTGCRHGWSAEGSVLAGSILIDIERITDLFGNTPVMFHCDSNELRPEDAASIRELVYRLFTYSRAAEGRGRLLFNSLSYQLVYQLTNQCLASKNDPVWNYPQDGPRRRTYDILRYVNENYAQPITLASLAERLNLTTPYLSKLFKEQFGTTFLSYLQSVRLKHAEGDVLNSEKSLTRIALDNGFPNSASFIRRFRQEYGVTPSEYRKNAHTGDLPVQEEPEVSREPAGNEEIQAMVRAHLDNYRIRPDTAPPSGQEHINVSRHPRSLRANLPFEMPWRKLLNVGNAANLLRYDVREHVRMLHETLHFEYLYIGNLLHPSMNIYTEKTGGKPNFSELRKVLDFVVSLGMHPYIELESQELDTPREINSRLMEANVKSHLAVLYTNYELLDSLQSFLIRRYGREEVSKWRISLEHSTAVNNRVSEEDYFRYFASIYKMVKSRVPDIRIGGPGFTIEFQEETLEAFLKKWLAAGCTPDFINLYVFPYNMDMESLKEGRNVASADPDYLANTLNALNHVMQRLGLSDLETHVTIWNSTMSNRNVLNDGCFKAAYIMNSLLGSWDKCQFIGYWNASDIPVLDPEVHLPFFGGNGLLAQNGLRKPAYYAVRFLNHLYPWCLVRTKHTIVTADDRGCFAICCHNYKHYNYLYYQRPESRIKPEEHSLYYEDHENLSLTFTINDLPEGEFLIRKRYVSEHTGNIQDSWLKMSSLEELSGYEQNYLSAQSEPGLSYTKMRSVKGTIVLEETLRPQEVCLILIELIYD